MDRHGRRARASREQHRKPYIAEPGTWTWLVAYLALRTGIAPNDLLETSDDILGTMLNILHPKLPEVDPWQILDSLASG
jgi:hypothetical protein